MNIFQSIRTVLRNYAEFTGRAGRPEFWWFALFLGIGHLALNSLNVYSDSGTLYLGASLSGAFGLVTLVPALAVSVRRLRDAGRSWAELFWLLLPIVGLIILIVHLAEPAHDLTTAPTPSGPPTPAPAV